mgnify:CR=1 FL=1
MKKIIFTLILIIGIVVGGSFQVGRVIEAELPTILERVGELGQMKISITGYERNIFRSSVTSEISLASPGGKHEQIFLRHEIWHGPLPFGQSSDGRWHFKPMSAVVETSVDRTKPPSGLIGDVFAHCPELYDSFELTEFDFAGNGLSNYSVPGFERSFGEGDETITLDWQGMNGVATIDKSMKNIKGNVTIPSVRILTETSRVESSNIRSSYRVFEDFGGLLLGNVTLDAATMSLSSNQGKTELNDFQFRNAAQLEEDTVSYSISIGIETIMTAGETYGPAGFELDFTGLDAATILKVQKQLQTIQAEVKALTEEEISNRIFAIYADALPELIKRDPEIKLNYLNMTGPTGEFWSQGVIRFTNPGGRKINDMQSFLATIRASSDSQVSKDLLRNILTGLISEQLAEAKEAGQLGDISVEQLIVMAEGASIEQLNKLVADGAIVDEGKNYRALFKFEKREATLNGKPLQLFPPQ